MKIATVGNGKSGSWKIRGEQLGRAIGATPSPHLRDPAGFDRIIIVKRVDHDLIRRARSIKVPVVYDIVDAWQGQQLNGRESSLRWLRNQLTTARANAFVAATCAMADDCLELGFSAFALPHHALPDQPNNPIREKVSSVGYAGSSKYIQSWKPIIEQECARRGWKFVVNPERLADVDIAIALRDDSSYAARHWKSNVKLANAQATGTPCVVNREMGYIETASGAEHFADDLVELREAFDALTPYDYRLKIGAMLRAQGAPRVALDVVAETYRTWLCSLKF